MDLALICDMTATYNPNGQSVLDQVSGLCATLQQSFPQVCSPHAMQRCSTLWVARSLESMARQVRDLLLSTQSAVFSAYIADERKVSVASPTSPYGTFITVACLLWPFMAGPILAGDQTLVAGDSGDSTQRDHYDTTYATCESLTHLSCTMFMSA